jgi:A/G-specific adenine glycosylase
VSAVIAAWAGLGYNRRAVNLHRAASEVVTAHGGTFPSTVEGLLALPGIGPYTARAVMVFAHEADIGVVDTNVRRVLARWSGRSHTPAEAQLLADDLVPSGRGWAWNQALFDLGASLCRARSVACEDCPVAEWCSWQGEGADPATPVKRQSTFAGSDRQGRGRLVDALRRAPVPAAQLASTMGWPDDPDRARRVAATLVDAGLAIVDDGHWHLPT